MSDDIQIIRQILNDNQFTQIELADRLGVAPQFLSNIITGKKSVGFSTRKKLKTLFPKYFTNAIPEISDSLTSNELISIRKTYGYSQVEFAKLIGISNSLLNKLESGERVITDSTITKIKSLSQPEEERVVDIMYLKDKTLSKGYQRSQNTSSTITLSKRLFTRVTDLEIVPSHCRIVQVGSDMISSQYQQGDLVVLDESFIEFIDGYIFAFEYKNRFYVREVYLLPERIKCVPLNEKQDTFYINNNEEVVVFGLVVPRIRF